MWRERLGLQFRRSLNGCFQFRDSLNACFATSGVHGQGGGRMAAEKSLSLAPSH